MRKGVWNGGVLMYVPQPWCRRCIREGVGGGEVRKGVSNGESLCMSLSLGVEGA